jgi:hypothetical protein
VCEAELFCQSCAFLVPEVQVGYDSSFTVTSYHSSLLLQAWHLHPASAAVQLSCYCCWLASIAACNTAHPRSLRLLLVTWLFLGLAFEAVQGPALFICVCRVW